MEFKTAKLKYLENACWFQTLRGKVQWLAVIKAVF